MNRSQKTTNFLVLYTFLLSGLSFFSLPADKGQAFLPAISATATAIAIFFALSAYLRLRKANSSFPIAVKTPRLLSALFFLGGFLVCSVIYSFFTSQLSKTLAATSAEFEGGRFSVFFAILSLLLALYMGKRGLVSFSRMCILFLPLILFPFVITFFDFLEYGSAENLKAIDFESAFSISSEYLPDAFLLCAGVSFLFFMASNDEASKETDFHPAAPFFAFVITLILEGAKYVLWFGTDGYCFIDRPDKTMLAQVPFMNVQEIFLFSYYVAYVIKISVFCTVSRIFLQKAQKIIFKKELPKFLNYGICAVFLSIFHIIFGKNVGRSLAIIAFLLLFIAVFAYELSVFFLNRHFFGEKFPKPKSK